jgi:flagellar biosynthetic protein FliR
VNALISILPTANEWLWHLFSVFLRVAAVASMLPAFGEQSVPARVKLMVGIAFTLIVAPALNIADVPDSMSGLYLFCLCEILAGLALGIGIRLFVLSLQTAGSIAAQSTSLSQVLGGAAVDPLPAMGYILIVGALALAVIAGLHVKAAEFLILSYDFFPIGEFVLASDFGHWGTQQVSRAFTLAFTLAAPFVIISVLYNFALGAINKAMPQLMVAFVGAPVITLGGLFILMIAAPAMLSVWMSALDGYLSNPLAVNR